MSYEILPGDCLPTLRGMEDSSIDLIATDPPYGISFMGKAWDKALPDPAIWRECLRVLKPGASAVVMSGSRLDCLWRMCRDLEDAGFELSQTAMYHCYRSGFPKGQDLSKAADARAGAEREVVGKTRRCVGPSQAESEYFGAATDWQNSNLLTAPATDLAKTLDGWFTKGKVKPAVEVIIWARKPISEKTELDNMIRWGVGGVNCGACMVPSPDKQASSVRHARPNEGVDPDYISGGWRASDNPEGYVTGANDGRFPANMLCMDNALGAGSKYFDIDRWAAENGYTEDGWAQAAAAGLLQVAKPSKAEKNAGCEGLEEKPVQDSRFNGNLLGSEWNPDPRSPNGGYENKPLAPSRNPHPTCKPVRLFAYLCDFLCPPAGTVLDPFCGSGTTGVAAVQTGRNFMGCELEADYVPIAEARLAHAEAEQPAQLTLTA